MPNIRYPSKSLTPLILLLFILIFGILSNIGSGPPPQQQMQPVQLQSRFDYDVHKPYMGTGNNSIIGQGFLRQRGGGVVTCAGSLVLLLPDTPFFREIITHLRTGNTPQFVDEAERVAYNSMLRQSQCDAQGNYVFNSLPDGNWIILTEVKWTVPSRYSSSQQGGALMQEVQVANGERKQVLLTDKDFTGR